MWFIQKAKTPYEFCALPATFTWSRVVCLTPEPKKCPGFSAPWAGAGTQWSTLHLTGRARGGLHGRSRPDGVSLCPLSAPGLPAVPLQGPKPAGRRLQERPSPRRAGPQPPGLGAQSWSLGFSGWIGFAGIGCINSPAGLAADGRDSGLMGIRRQHARTAFQPRH